MDIQLSEVWVYNVKFANIELIKKKSSKNYDGEIHICEQAMIKINDYPKGTCFLSHTHKRRFDNDVWGHDSVTLKPFFFSLLGK